MKLHLKVIKQKIVNIFNGRNFADIMLRIKLVTVYAFKQYTQYNANYMMFNGNDRMLI